MEAGALGGDSKTRLLKDFPREYACPITLQLMNDCVLAEDGHTYERDAIARWFNTGQTRSPVTNEVLERRTLLPNHVLKRIISQYRANLGEQLLRACITQASQTDSRLESTIQDLLDRGADVNTRHAGTGKTALLILIEANKFALATRLIQCFGADPSLADDAMHTCAQAAAAAEGNGQDFKAFVQEATKHAVTRHEREMEARAQERDLFRQQQAARSMMLTANGNMGFFPSLFSLQFQAFYAIAPRRDDGGQQLRRRISTWSRLNLMREEDGARADVVEPSGLVHDASNVDQQTLLSTALLYMSFIALLCLIVF